MYVNKFFIQACFLKRKNRCELISGATIFDAAVVSGAFYVSTKVKLSVSSAKDCTCHSLICTAANIDGGQEGYDNQLASRTYSGEQERMFVFFRERRVLSSRNTVDSVGAKERTCELLVGYLIYKNRMRIRGRSTHVCVDTAIISLRPL